LLELPWCSGFRSSPPLQPEGYIADSRIPVLWEQRLNVMQEVADWLAKYDKELVAVVDILLSESRSVLGVLQIASVFVQNLIHSGPELIQC
jgi:hypothetical protein